MNYKARKRTNRREIVWVLQFAVALAALTTMPMAASAQTDALAPAAVIYSIRVRNLDWRLPVRKSEGIWATSIDLIGTASNLHSAADIIGAYNAADPAAAIIKRERLVRLENKKGVVLEIRAVNLNRWISLNLSAITLKNLGWQPASQ